MAIIIDCDDDPFVPEGWTVEEHHKGGQLVWDPANVKLWLSEGQKGEKWIEGNKLRKELADKPVLNAKVLDYLLAHPEIIPEEWEKDNNGNIRYIFFWGTVYRSSGGRLVVRCLYWSDGEWIWYYYWLGYGWHGDSPAALLAN